MTASSRRPFVVRAVERLRLADPALLVACALFLAIGWWGAGRLPVAHEEIATFPERAARVLVGSPGGLVMEPSCADPAAPAFVRSEARPRLALCAGGLTLPVVIMPYSAGVPYWHALATWPLHRGNAFWMRRWDLLAGVLSLWLVHRLVGRFATATAASAAVLLVAISSPFVVLHSMLLQYESTPWILTVGAILLLVGRAGDGAPSSRRLAIAAVLWGLAIVANVKAAFYAGPVLLVAWRAGALRLLGRRAIWAALLVALTAGLLVLANALHGGRGLEMQLSSRIGFLARGTTASDVWDEVLNMLRFATDTGTYATARWQPIPVAGIAAAAIGAAGALYAIGSSVRLLAGRRANALAAVSGLLLVMYVAISLKLYGQRPAANYAPVYAIFGISVALAMASAAARLARRIGLAVTVACMIPLACNTVVRLAGAEDLPLSVNTRAEREIAAYLADHPRPGETIYTSTYNLAGVLDSLGGGAIATVRLDRALKCRQPGGDAAGCLGQQWREILTTPGVLPARIVLPSVETLADDPDAMLLAPTLREAAREVGVDVTVERDFAIGSAATAMALVRVSAPHAGYGWPTAGPASTVALE
jgi:hypothetical protein